MPLSREKFAEWIRLQTFDDPELEKLVDACQEFYNAFDLKQSPRWLSLIGTSGAGKTHCAKKLWHACYRRLDFTRCEFIPQVIYWPDFVQRLKAGNAYEMRNDMKRWPMLFLDDVGADRDTSGFAAEELNTLLGCRLGRWTLLTSNLEFEAIAKIDGRISSRLIRDQNICVSIKTQDFFSR